ncbi:large ribosomal subunit protein bL28 [Candidatus Deianiraea vastatrix]|nr:L28 family ribosomal protein [Candidatus Deianiraea vastatrix]
MSRCEVTSSTVSRGNNVPKSNKKTRRTIKNSVANRKFFSKVFGSYVYLKCTKAACDTIIKHGGIDCYVLNVKNSRISDEISAIKTRMLKCIENKNLTEMTPEQIQFL